MKKIENNSIYKIGDLVKTRKNTGRLGGDKRPNRLGIVHGFNSVDATLVYVNLDATSRAKQCIDSFWNSELEKIGNTLCL